MMNDDAREGLKADKGRKRFRTVVLAVVLLVLLACGAWLAYSLGAQRHEVLPGEVILNGNMSFEKADEKLMAAGFKPMGISRQYHDVVNQYYEGMEVCGYTTEYSYLSVDTDPDKGNIQIVHVFKDTKESSAENPGEICRAVKEELTRRIGEEPVEGTDENGRFWCWALKGSAKALLVYVGKENLLLSYVYSK